MDTTKKINTQITTNNKAFPEHSKRIPYRGIYPKEGAVAGKYNFVDFEAEVIENSLYPALLYSLNIWLNK